MLREGIQSVTHLHHIHTTLETVCRLTQNVKMRLSSFNVTYLFSPRASNGIQMLLKLLSLYLNNRQNSAEAKKEKAEIKACNF